MPERRPSIPTVRAVILAGGQSRRFGADKAQARLSTSSESTTFLDHAVAVLDALAAPITILGPPRPLARSEPVEWWQEPSAGEGPLSALRQWSQHLPETDERPIVVLACDYPLVSTELLASAARRAVALGGAAAAVVPRVGGYAHPLAACYTRAAFRALGESSGRRVCEFVESLDVAWWVLPSRMGRRFRNVNEPADWPPSA